MRNIALAIAVVGALLAVAAPSHAAPILDFRVDFNNYATSPGANWYTAPGNVTDAALTDFSTGSQTGATMTVGTTSTYAWSRGASANNWNTANALPSWVDAAGNAVKDFNSLGWNLIGLITFKNLDPSLKYTLEVVSSTNGGGYNVPYTVNGANLQTFNCQTQGYALGQWLTWTDLSPDASNQIVLRVGSSGSYNKYINALRLSATPEPATLMLVAVSGLLAFRRRG